MANLQQMAWLIDVSEVTVGKLVKDGIVLKKNGPGDYNGPETCRCARQPKPRPAARTRLAESARAAELAQRAKEARNRRIAVAENVASWHHRQNGN
jgi:hypothetical protein